MKRIIIFISLYLLGLQIAFANVNSINTQSGYDLANELTQRYNDTRNDCGDEDRPAFLCSGIMLRGTVPSDNYYSWNPSPRSQASGGVSFSYLRTDSKLLTLDAGYTNGFIFSPYLSASANNKEHPEALCYFPLNADSANRNEKGCGSNPYYSQSAPCQQQGITTAQQWINNGSSELGQCGFDVSIKPGANHANAFIQGVQARLQLALTVNNELILATWPQNIPHELPIEAFFYLQEGLAGAQHDQRDFLNATGKIIPIVRIELPSDYSQDATFTYNPEDQIIRN
ncbi:N-acyl homoserine lactonase [Xenorhabdus sp. PR6a]|uniref:N-acyl homoserine lactonase n=1 Tax=Xenorhabdus sp. PR6a TaxID=3025877 RepID=UPI0023591247|nr:N-acyl homoserine lactonase [Xenorhabdus sp. PR6a]MDC9582883.1 N-acyl homoserine lactonase [Xenorhabdus sp. PR6a]